MSAATPITRLALTPRARDQHATNVRNAAWAQKASEERRRFALYGTELCGTCDGHTGEIDARERFIACGDCGGAGTMLADDVGVAL